MPSGEFAVTSAKSRHSKYHGKGYRCIYQDRHEDPRGTRIRDAFTLKESVKEVGIPSNSPRNQPLNDKVFASLLDRVNNGEGGMLYIDEAAGSRTTEQFFLHRSSSPCNLIKIGGVSFQPEQCSLKDSNVMYSDYRNPHQVQAGRIVSIFLHRRHVSSDAHVEETFIAVNRLVPLTSDDEKHDNFRRYKAGGALYYDKYRDCVDIVSPKEALCHFARMALTLPVIEQPCVHVLPLDRVRLHFHLLFRYYL